MYKVRVCALLPRSHSKNTRCYSCHVRPFCSKEVNLHPKTPDLFLSASQCNFSVTLSANKATKPKTTKTENDVFTKNHQFCVNQSCTEANLPSPWCVSPILRPPRILPCSNFSAQVPKMATTKTGQTGQERNTTLTLSLLTDKAHRPRFLAQTINFIRRLLVPTTQ